MSDRVQELAQRRAALRLRCAAQRRAVAREMHGIEARLGSVDRVAAVVRGTIFHPAVVAVAATVLFALGRTRTFRLAGRGLLIAAGVRRLLQAARKI